MPLRHTPSFLAAATSPHSPSAATVLLLTFGAAAVTLAMAALFGLLRPSRLGLTRAVPPGRPIAPLLGVMLAGVVVWVVAPTLLLEPAPADAPGPVAETQPDKVLVPARELVFVTAAVPAVAFLILAVGDALVRPLVGQRLGFELKRFPRGVVAGVTGMLVAAPLVYAAMVLSEWVYRQAGYRHPNEHDLLRVMGDARDPLIKYLAIVAAVVVAPLWEELLFRGHIQTLLREALTRLRAAAKGTAGFPDDAGRRARPLESWGAILLASLLFAGVHQPWTAPPIFCLSVCFGLAYERTGNLWTSVTMHAMFNGVMTTIYLVGVLPN